VLFYYFPVMKNYALLYLAVACVFTVSLSACNGGGETAENKALQGAWKAKDGKTKLEITSKKFILDEDGPIEEDYYLKGDTILTSFEGNQPYTPFVIQKLDAKELHLLFPDSVVVEFSR
jgi:uncharacterized lipoprotein YehR (DUF1307 family)